MTTRAGLTLMQDRLLLFLEERLSGGRTPPSYTEMCAHLGLKAKSNIFRLLAGLEDRGFITRLPGKSRSIALRNQDPLVSISDSALISTLELRGYVVTPSLRVAPQDRADEPRDGSVGRIPPAPGRSCNFKSVSHEV
jgi:SOS-response transcriptional repressor LexA